MVSMSWAVAYMAAIRATPGSMAVRASSTSRMGASANCRSRATVEASWGHPGRRISGPPPGPARMLTTPWISKKRRASR